MTDITFTRRRKKKNHRELITATALFVMIMLMVTWSLSNSLSTRADAGTITEQAVEETPILTSSQTIEEEPAKYSFGSIKESSSLKCNAGDEINTQIGFYNVDGNRDTHITMTVDNAPEGWVIEVDPTLTVEVQELLQEPAEQLEEGTIGITVGDRGYAIAKTCGINITAPDDVEQGTTAEITITAKAEWYGQTGQAVIYQTRSFDYRIEVI